MSNKELTKKSKELAFLLRHDKDYQFDDKGYREVSDLIKNHGFSLNELETIVANDEKGRYEFDSDAKQKIRARQGHSISVNVELEKLTPPDILYHGTTIRFLDSIYKQGLIKGSRLYVHLSSDEETAIKVGQRHGWPYVLKIDSKKMSDDGVIFFKSRNGVWLTDYVDPKYFI